MHYYRSSELAEQYGVSRRTVTNWVKQAREGKLKLELVEERDDFYIAKSRPNQAHIQSIVKERQKYVNKKSRDTITPKKEFYSLFTDDHIYDIIHNLRLYRELPLQYTYFGEGAEHWNKFRLSCGLMDAERLLKASMSYIDWVVMRYGGVNVVDLGVGNGDAARPLLERLYEHGKLKKYTGIDLSPDMLEIAIGNIEQWFNGEVKTEAHIRDITNETFRNLIIEPPDDETHEQTTINIVLLLGGHLSNFRDPAEVLRLIHRSMGAEDILITNFKLGVPAVKSQLDFITNYQEQGKILLNLLNISPDLYESEIGFSEREQMRYSKVRFKKALTIRFDIGGGKWHVDFKKDEELLIYRALFNDTFSFPEEVFYQSGFHPLMTAQRVDHEGMLLVADLRKIERR